MMLASVSSPLPPPPLPSGFLPKMRSKACQGLSSGGAVVPGLKYEMCLSPDALF